MKRANVQSVHRGVRGPRADGCFGALRHRGFGFVIGPAVRCSFNHEVELLSRVVTLPVPAVVGEKIPVPVDPRAVKRIAHATGQHAVFSRGRVHPKQRSVPSIVLIAHVARRAAVPDQGPVGHCAHAVGLVISNRNTAHKDLLFNKHSPG